MAKPNDLPRSKVVHVRLPIATLIGCFDMIEIVAQKDTSATPSSSVVSDVLSGFISGARKRGSIPSYSDEELLFRIEEIFGPQATSDFDADFDLSATSVGEDDNSGTPAPSADDAGPSLSDAIKHAAQEIESRNARASTDSLYRDPSSQSDPPPQQPSSPTTIDLSGCRAWEDIRAEAPKDRFIQACIEDEELIPVVRFIYDKIPLHLWGSAKAEELITELCETDFVVIDSSINNQKEDS